MKRIAYILGVVAVATIVGYLAIGQYIVETVPGYRLVEGSVEIFNCEEPRNENAADVCPSFYCWKAIYESGQISGEHSFRELRVESPGEGSPVIRGGEIDYGDANESQALTRYRCTMRGDEVLSFDLLGERE